MTLAVKEAIAVLETCQIRSDAVGHYSADFIELLTHLSTENEQLKGRVEKLKTALSKQAESKLEKIIWDYVEKSDNLKSLEEDGK